MTLEEYLSRLYGPADTTTRRRLNEALADLIDDLRADGYRVVKLEQVPARTSSSDAFRFGGVYGITEELT